MNFIPAETQTQYKRAKLGEQCQNRSLTLVDLDDTHTVTCDFFISPENMSDEVQFSTVKFPVLQCHHNLESMQTFPGDCSILS